MSNIASIRALLKPGRPLLITGPHGCGKLHCTRLALEELGLKALSVHLEHVDVMDSYPDSVPPHLPIQDPMSIRARCKSAPGNMAILFNEIEQVDRNPMFIAPILEVMMNPDRYVVLLGLRPPCCLPLIDRCIDRCEHITMVI
jgi:hypothetical protein